MSDRKMNIWIRVKLKGKKKIHASFFARPLKKVIHPSLRIMFQACLSKQVAGALLVMCYSNFYPNRS